MHALEMMGFSVFLLLLLVSGHAAAQGIASSITPTLANNNYFVGESLQLQSMAQHPLSSLQGM